MIPVRDRLFSHPGFKIWAGAQADIDRVIEIWRDCLAKYKGPYLFGKLSMADAMYAPACARLRTYDVRLDDACATYRDRALALPWITEWVTAALAEPDEVEELDAEF